MELNEAAEIDGANKWEVFRHITFPLLSPTTYFLSLIGIIGTFKAFNHLVETVGEPGIAASVVFKCRISRVTDTAVTKQCRGIISAGLQCRVD